MYEVPKILGDDGAGPPPWEGSVDDAPLETRYFPHMCYRTKFRRSGSNRLGTGRGVSKFGGAGTPLLLGIGAWLIPYKHTPPPYVLPHQISSLYVKPLGRNYGNPPENFDPSRPAFQGHSRSLEPTRIGRLPVTSYCGHLVQFPR